jgi:hypothetical protein
MLPHQRPFSSVSAKSIGVWAVESSPHRPVAFDLVVAGLGVDQEVGRHAEKWRRKVLAIIRGMNRHTVTVSVSGGRSGRLESYEINVSLRQPASTCALAAPLTAKRLEAVPLGAEVQVHSCASTARTRPSAGWASAPGCSRIASGSSTRAAARAGARRGLPGRGGAAHLRPRPAPDVQQPLAPGGRGHRDARDAGPHERGP